MAKLDRGGDRPRPEDGRGLAGPASGPGLSQIKADIEAAFGDIFDVSELIGDTRADLEAADAALGSAIGSLDSRADTLETQTASLDANKASVESLNAQITRIDNAEAVNASQALALVDLENGKVALSEYNTLKGEVTAARDGSTTLLGKIQNLKSVDLDLQTNKASVESVNALTARTANTEADIIDIENAQANDRTATAQAVEQVRAAWRGQAINANPSFAQWPDPSQPPTGWQTSGYVTREAGKVSPYCARLTSEATLLYAGADLRAVGGGAFIIEADVRRTSSTGTFADAAILLQAFDDGGNLLPGGSQSFTIATAPLDPSLNGGDVTVGDGFQGETYRLRLFCDVRYAATRRFYLSAVSLAPNLAFDIDQLAIEPATNAEILSGRNLPALSASVTEQSLAIIDLENGAAIASWQKRADATGGKPTILELVSSMFGNYIALTADQIYLGANTVFDDATDTWRTDVGTNARQFGFGAPFGANGDLLEWWGPADIPVGSMTTANGLNGRMTSPPYVFDNVTASNASALKKLFSGAITLPSATIWTDVATIAFPITAPVPNPPIIDLSLRVTGGGPPSSGLTYNCQTRWVERNGSGDTVLGTTANLTGSYNNVDGVMEWSSDAVNLSNVVGTKSGVVSYVLQAQRVGGVSASIGTNATGVAYVVKSV